jgi:DtxR family Mn-dependent transcriptional regulator
MLSLVEENYLKAIYHLSEGGKTAVTTNAIAENMNNKAASVTDMVKRLSSKGVIAHEKYYGVTLSTKGKTAALRVIRKHRLWETFLVQKLGFHWDEVHEVAEQLEHIQSTLLIEKLDAFLGYPEADPHGHPIPDRNGKIHQVKQVPLSVFAAETICTVRSVRDASPTFLQYLSKIGVCIGAKISILEKMEFDGSVEIMVDGRNRGFISKEASENILVT